MFSFSTIQQYHQQLNAAEISCEAVVQHYLTQIKQQQHLNAFIEVYETEALQKAQQLDALRKAGTPLKKLHGVVIAIKDVICYAGHKVSAASNILQNFESLYTATALQFLIDEDAIIIGNCNCDEFAMGSTNENSYYGKVLNALDHTKVPGGSSGGSAVAVQAGMCMLSLGSDTGGSVRQPADFCGIIGLKPSYGAISRYGLIAYASSFDQIGIFGTTVQDVALLFSIMHQPDVMDSTMLQTTTAFNFEPHHPQKKYKFAFLQPTLQTKGIDVEIAGAITSLQVQLHQGNHLTDVIDFEYLDYIVPAYYVLTTAEASSNLSRYDGIRYGHQSALPAANLNEFYLHNRTEGFGDEVKKRIMLGTFVLSTGYYDAFYNKAQKIRRLLVDQVTKIFETYDAIILPVCPTTAFNIGQNDKDPIATYLADIFTVFANLTGLPALAVPLFSHSNNMPFGVQILTNKNHEVILHQIADMLMSEYKITAV
ncbi:Asp-tRNA(Asn)/Glu-tRNA(Gln) amidotransferase subunit GatA [Ferruginibacter yonginensis]|uniref:Glutamyl-tRNA(Gln) amidotransferase subunit A n=1 Tax=Ferruginibacter yonginensis TaxID=1310416 RepID=A0ABV8QSY7_9BACT